MLPRDRRVTDARDFREISRRGRRAASRTLVVHLRSDEAGEVARAGFVVGRAVGDSVTRHRVVRRLRHQATPVLDGLPSGTSLVVRALPPAASASSTELGRDLVTCVERLRRGAVTGAGAGS